MGGVRHQEYSSECGISAASNGARPTVSLIQLVRTTRICEFLQQTMANGDYVVRPTTLVPEPDTQNLTHRSLILAWSARFIPERKQMHFPSRQPEFSYFAAREIDKR